MKKVLSHLLFFIVFLGHAQTYTILQPACNNNGVVVFDLSGTGATPPFSYSWYQNYVLVRVTSSTNNLTDTLFNYSGGPAYCIFTTNGMAMNGGNLYSPPFTYTVTSTTNTCPSLSTATCAVTGALQPYTVQWLNAGSGSLAATGTVVALPKDPYWVKITDGNGCVFGSQQQNDSLYIYQNSPISFTDTSTAANCSNGSATITSVAGGLAPYTYVWSNGAAGPQANNLIWGNYSVIITDAQGCIASDNFNISQAVNINVNVVPSSATCLQNDGGAISFGSGGVPPYSYIYSNGQTTQAATGLVYGSYNVQVADANGCLGSTSFFINSSTPISVTYSASQSLCTAATGSATLSINGGQPPYLVNWSTSPLQSGPVLNSVYGGSYYFTVTDANGCVQTGSAVVPSVSNMSVFPYSSPSSCPGNSGAATMYAWSTNLPLTYLWSTGATGASINNLAPGMYSCIVTDAVGCQLNKSIQVTYVSPLNVGFANMPSTCRFRNDGVMNLSVTGGTVPYSYSWSNGQTTQNITGLVGDTTYWVTVTDANGCSSGKQWNYLGTNLQNDSCYCIVSGNIYHDVNGNCIKDPGEINIPNILVKNNNSINNYPIHSYQFTDTAGMYSFILPTGNYNLQEVIQYIYPPSSCQSNSNPLSLVASSGCSYTVDFANGVNPLHDIHLLWTHLSLPVPGNNYVQQIIVQNDGTVTENNIEMGYAHDGQLPLVNSSGISFNQPNSGLAPNWYNASAISLNPGQAVSDILTYTVPTNIPLGTQVNFWDTAAYTPPMNNWLNDYSPWNNVNIFDVLVVGSFDPNVKEVYPVGVGPLGYITSNDTVLDYVIHFQNTGNYPASKIVVVDTLDADLAWETLRPGFSNHNYTASMDRNGVVTFTFNNIQLPPQSNSALGSIGTFAYSIHVKKNLSQGTQFKNSAAIFFDYNSPVITNTTINTINNSIGISVVKSADGYLKLYPNPTSDKFSISLTSFNDVPDSRLEIFSLDGRRIYNDRITLVKGENTYVVSTDQLNAGLYIVRMLYEGRLHTAKLSIVK